MDSRKPFHEQVAGKLIEQLQSGTAPWQKPWEAGRQGAGMPMNPVSGKRYKGINAVFLAAQGYDDPRWMTYNQAQGMGAQVRKGEHGTPVQYWKFTEEQIRLDVQGQPMLGPDNKPIKETVQLERPRVFFATVFNAQQIDGLAPLQRREQSWDSAERAEALLRSSGASIRHVEGDRAFYRFSTDTIQMPDKGQFDSAAKYYAVALHELGHWTGHKSRLGRDLSNPFGSEAYAREELRAEIASLMVGDRLGLGHDPGQHAAYVGSWIKALKEDPLEIFRAAADAERIHNFVMSFDQHEEHQQEAALSTALDQENRRIDAALAQREAEASAPRVYIDVPFREKDRARALGARWDRQEHAWYIPHGMDAAAFAAWPRKEPGQDQAAAQPLQDPGQDPRTYLAVPYRERFEAKRAGARWDPAAKSWYAGDGADISQLAKWLPAGRPEQAPAMDPRTEFAQALRSLGFAVEGDHPIMDGKTHRLATAGDRGAEKSGFYVGHLDGHPAGYLKNNRSGEELKWKSKGYAVSEEERARLRAEAAQKLAERAAQQEQTHEAAARRVQAQARGLQPVVQPTDYLRAKGIQAHEGALTDAQGRTTFLPAVDKDGKQWSMQYIDREGTKRFAKDSRKEGCFHAVGGLNALEKAPLIVMGEGYATMATLKEQLGLPATVAAFDSGNLLPVAKALRERFPDKPILVAGDDDRVLAMTLGTNPGREKAEAAARAVGGKAIFPIFAPGENDYPAHLPPVTPQAFRAHEQARARLDQDQGTLGVQEKQALLGELLQPAQLDAIAAMKKHTDFNDLAQRSVLGSEALLRQVGPEVKQARQIHQADRQKQGQEKTQAPRPGQRQGVRQRQGHGMRAG